MRSVSVGWASLCRANGLVPGGSSFLKMVIGCATVNSVQVTCFLTACASSLFVVDGAGAIRCQHACEEFDHSLSSRQGSTYGRLLGDIPDHNGMFLTLPFVVALGFGLSRHCRYMAVRSASQHWAQHRLSCAKAYPPISKPVPRHVKEPVSCLGPEHMWFCRCVAEAAASMHGM